MIAVGCWDYQREGQDFILKSRQKAVGNVFGISFTGMIVVGLLGLLAGRSRLHIEK
jgi:hypothetical protein